MPKPPHVRAKMIIDRLRRGLKSYGASQGVLSDTERDIAQAISAAKADAQCRLDNLDNLLDAVDLALSSWPDCPDVSLVAARCRTCDVEKALRIAYKKAKGNADD